MDRFHNAADKKRDPIQLKAQRQRFLQFHDQQTAGIPGLCPLYVGLKMRVAEKIRKSKQIFFLKHTPCTVVGWRLHDLDRKQDPHCNGGGERFLDYLPEWILVKFEDVDWQVKGFAPGVLPIFPEKHDWTSNKAMEAKAERHGFRLIPDFASTAFMMQGTSLQASLVDCGDVDAAGSFGPMVTAYVILSRVKGAHGLALLRGFSPELFNTGVAPGPHCLMKFLRTKAARGDEAEVVNNEYSTEHAQEEYTYRLGRVTGRIKFVSRHGLPLRCHGCNNRLCPAAYDEASPADFRAQIGVIIDEGPAPSNGAWSQALLGAGMPTALPRVPRPTIHSCSGENTGV